MARLIAGSDLIVIARLPPDAAAIIDAATEPNYVSIPPQADTILKGAAPAGLVLRYYANRQSGTSIEEALAAASGCGWHCS
jgi:hypothetical protein